MASRLEDEQAPYIVEAFEGVAPLGENRLPAERLHASGHNPEGLAARVVVGGRDHLTLRGSVPYGAGLGCMV
jgi:hypothetical protein